MKLISERLERFYYYTIVGLKLLSKNKHRNDTPGEQQKVQHAMQLSFVLWCNRGSVRDEIFLHTKLYTNAYIFYKSTMTVARRPITPDEYHFTVKQTSHFQTRKREEKQEA